MEESNPKPNDEQRGWQAAFASLSQAGQAGVSLRTQLVLLAGAAAAMVALGIVEAAADALLGLSLLYLLPVATVTWFVSRRAGVAFALCAGAVSLLSALLYSPLPPAMAVWNGAMRAGVLLVVVFLLALVRSHTRSQDEAVRDRTDKLNAEIAERKRAEREFFKLLQEQREQIAYDLHDDLAQVLTAIAMKTKHLERELEAGFSTHAAAAGAIVKRMNEAVGQTREIARGLCPIDAQASELVAAIRRLVADVARDYGITCTSTSSHSNLHYSRDAAVHIYRIAQQAIDNAIRHGEATAVEVRLEQNKTHFRLCVCDNGRGFQADDSRAQGLGLRTMAFRADVIGGTFHIAPDPAGGTLVEVVAEVSGLLPGSEDEVTEVAPSKVRAL
jgi:signal transduction histidine kinase